jgi:dihydrofolate reductase
MAKLIYSAIASADGYVEDAAGRFDWAAPGEELHRFVNDLERPVGTYLYGRPMYETMLYWQTAGTVPGQPPSAREFAGIWQAAEKIVFSTTLASVSSARTRIERNFDPGMVRRLKSATEHDMTVGVRTWPGRPSRPGWSTSCSCSWFPSSSEAASERSPTASALS